MFTKPIFETLPILITAFGILLIALVHHPVALISGAGLILASCIMLYRHYTELGTDANALDEGHSI
ncbi:MAG: hypothetical protein PVG75_10085 [Thioalkalispiraceae bacterium]|jgi:hypothetical protein